MNFYTTGELLQLPSPKWLIRHVLPESGLSLLFGPPGEGKSFVALDWALSISAGVPWLGDYPVNHGHVVYIAAEGGQGIKKRVAAWMMHHAIEKLPNITWFLEPLNFREEDATEHFISALRARFTTEAIHHENGTMTLVPFVSIRLIVVDTLSRSFGGEDENTSAAMTGFITEIEKFSHEYGAAVLIVHHTNAVGARERGHSSLKGAVEASFHVTAVKEQGTMRTITVENNKQKDDKDEGEIYLRPLVMHLTGLPRDEEGEVLTSLVLTRTGEDEGLEGALGLIMEALVTAKGAGLSGREIATLGRDHEIIRDTMRKALARGLKDKLFKAVPGAHSAIKYTVEG